MNTLAIVPAGGAGKRMGGETPKQYLPLAGIPVLVRTLQALHASPAIGEIFLAVPEKDIPAARGEIIERYRLPKVSLVLAGGAQRQDSVRNALMRMRDEHGIVLIHDGVRPFVSAELIGRVIAAAQECGAALVGVPVKETVKEVDEKGWVRKTVNREGLWLAQTPQVFRAEIIRAAHEKALRDCFIGTDDASLVERMGIPVRMIPGGEDNIKLTTRDDLAWGEIIARRFEAGAPR